MLYISKISEYGRYFVTDTDDNTKSPVTASQLIEIVCKLKINVQGVRTRTDANGNVHIVSIDEYAPQKLKKSKVADDVIPYKIVDRVSLNHFPNAKNTLEKAIGLENNDWTIVVNGVKMNSIQLNGKIKSDLSVGSSWGIRFYECVMEYEDSVNNIFYIRLGSVRAEDFYC